MVLRVHRAASIAGLDLVVVLPENVAAAKLKKIESYGVEVVLQGAESNLAEAHAQSLSVSRGPALCLALQ